jgi:hypothetical protein
MTDMLSICVTDTMLQRTTAIVHRAASRAYVGEMVCHCRDNPGLRFRRCSFLRPFHSFGAPVAD